jgi:predicted nucleic acid-binding protein
VVIFIDTSSIAKRYIDESGSLEIDAFFTEENQITISPITPIEIASLLNRKLRENSINQETFDLAETNFLRESPFFQHIPFSEKITSTALLCLSKYPLKTLDAIQLASAISLNPNLFVTSDKKLFDYASTALNCKCTLI